MSEKFLKAVKEKLEEAKEAEVQFKDTKIDEAIAHLEIELYDGTYADLLKEKMQEANGVAGLD